MRRADYSQLLVSVSRIQKCESKLARRVDATVRGNGDIRHAVVEQIAHGLPGLHPRFLDDFHALFQSAWIALNDKHDFPEPLEIAAIEAQCCSVKAPGMSFDAIEAANNLERQAGAQLLLLSRGANIGPPVRVQRVYRRKNTQRSGRCLSA